MRKRARKLKVAWCFSMLEILVVLAVLAMMFAIVTPKIGRIPQRLAVEQLLSTVRNAFSDASLRARSRGTTVNLVLENEGRTFRIQETGAPGLPGHEDSAEQAESTKKKSGILGKLEQYKLPDSIEWEEQVGVETESKPLFHFFPDGEATGKKLSFTVGERRFSLDVDRLSGRPLITELTD